MRRRNNKIEIFVGFLLLLIAVVFLPAWISDENPEKSDQDHVPYVIQGIKIPDKLQFAGEEVPLQRVDIRERLDRELLSNTYFHSNTLLLLKRANRFFPVIDTILQSEGIPSDFKYLALIESSLDIRAVSPAGAVGIWQFLRDTGREYGLEVNGEIDERYHLEKSTRAACRYFKKAYERFGSWTLVASSYNIGQRRISEELQRQKVNNYYDLLLVDETSRYVFRILAIREIFKDPLKFGFNLQKEDLYPEVKTKKIEISDAVNDFGLFANKYDISYGILKEFNPWLRDSFLSNKNNKTYIVEIPIKSYLKYNKHNIKVYQENWVVQ